MTVAQLHHNVLFVNFTRRQTKVELKRVDYIRGLNKMYLHFELL